MAFDDNQKEPSLPAGNSREKRKSINHLPKYFRTAFNSKFLEATVDQLNQPGSVEKLNGFFGRKIAKAYQQGDSYIGDTTKSREDYQFEPALVIEDLLGNVNFHADYNDYINQISILSGKTDNHGVLNQQEYYAWNPHIDWDKIVNFREYFWLPNGPETVTIVGQTKDIESTYTVGLSNNVDNFSYIFSPDGLTNNPNLTLYKGQTYRFEISTESYPIAFVSRITFTPGKAPGDETTNTSLFYTNGVTKYDINGNITNLDFISEGVIEFTVPDNAPETLFYISESDPNLSGQLRIFDIVENTEINVEKEIIGKKNYKTSDGWNFSNGFKVKFAGNVTPDIYGSGEWYVEGVGDRIKLVNQDDLRVSGIFTDDITVPFDSNGFDYNPFSEALGFATNKDYIVINRSSNDGNLWSRYNKWFHKSVIEESARLTNQSISLDQNFRASRPIIEFEAGLKLFNFGTVSKKNVDLLDDYTVDVFSTIEGSLGYNIDGIDLTEGQRILFTADTDNLVNGRIFKVTFVNINNRLQISLKEETDSIPLENENVLVTNGTKNKGKYLYYTGTAWKSGQEKVKINQAPLFDLYDKNNIQLNDISVYESSQFVGTKIFSYVEGNGSNDSELGFPLEYKNIENTGDIVFQFNLVQEKFTYVSENNLFELPTKNAFLRKYDNRVDFVLENGWIKAKYLSTQPVLKQFIADGISREFALNVYDDILITDIRIKVYKNNNIMLKSSYNLLQDTNGNVILNFVDIPKLNDVIFIKIYSIKPKNENGHYEIPTNLERNPLNGNMTVFTFGEINDHVSSIIENTEQFDGIYPGVSNLRDLGPVASLGNRFIKHSSPLFMNFYHFLDNNANIIKSIKYVRNEYAKFKRNFIETATNLDYSGPEKVFVDLILKDINKDKNSSNSFYFSDMVPTGGTVSTSLEVEDTDQQFLQLNNIFTLEEISKKSVQVYLNGVQLIHEIDYVFNSEGFVIVTCPKEIGDIIEVYEYETTNGSFVPATPTKLGLYPKFLPQFYIDSTYKNEIIENPTGSYKFYGCQQGRPTSDKSIGWFFPLYTTAQEAKNNDIDKGGTGNFSIIKFEGLQRIFYMPVIDQNLAVQDNPLYTEWTEGQPIIQGHDGSKTLAFKDFRDNLLLELEKRIFNNLKINYDPKMFDIHDFIPGMYRKIGVSRTDLNNAQLADFLEWTRLANVEYGNQVYYNKSDTFSFNYSKSTVNGENVPGWWREIYRYVYDTDRPHIRPWEMLGFSLKPIWWEDQYGPAPYTSNNLLLWQDIEKGIIRQPNFKIVSKYKRPGLSANLPVDSHGNLLSPNDSNLIDNLSATSLRNTFEFGDGAPVENAWKSTSEYPFSLLSSFILTQPSRVFSTGFDRLNQVRNVIGQIVYKSTDDNITNQDILYPISNFNQTGSDTSGLINYIIEYIGSSSVVQYETYKNQLANLDIKLILKIAGYTDKSKFKLILDSRTPLNQGNVFIPDENYKVFLSKSHAIKEIVYSAVIIEKQPEGFYVLGYDENYPVFEYKVVQQLNDDKTITVGGITEGFADWSANNTYVKGSLVRYNSSYYRVLDTHLSADSFDNKFFIKLDKIPVVGGVTAKIRSHYNKNVSKLPYGTLFTTQQEVVDFLLGYGKHLEDVGFSFTNFDGENYELLDWITSVRKFMFFLAQNWQEGTFITISPAAKQLNYKASNGTVGNILETFYGYSVKKSDGRNLKFENIKISKDSDNNFSLKSVNINDGIYAIRIPIITYEHAIVLDNKTVFNDIIYDREPGYRQERIKVLGYRTSDWNGTFNIPGFIFDNVKINEWSPYTDYNAGDIVKFKEFYYVSKQKVIGSELFETIKWNRLNARPEPSLLPNWDYKVNQFNDFYDLDSDNFDVEQQKLAQHLIGYQKRNYLANIVNDDVSQYKFYQGMILEKGTKNSLTKLFDALSSVNKDSLEFYEEWAIKDGQYGGSYTFDEIEFVIDENKVRQNPQSVLLSNNITSDGVDLIYRIQPHEVYQKPKNYNHKPFPTKYLDQGIIKHAGYVNPSDVNFVVGTYDDILELNIKEIYNKDYIWVGNVEKDWSVYQYLISNYQIEGIETGETDTFVVSYSTNIKDDISLGDICGLYEINAVNYTPQDSSHLAAEQLTSKLSGFFKVVDILLNKITFKYEPALAAYITSQFAESTGVFTTLKPVRVSNLNAANLVAEDGAELNDKIWIDNDSTDKWLVIQNQASYSQKIIVSNNQDAVQYFNFFAYIDINYSVNFLAEFSAIMTVYKDIDGGTLEDRFVDSITGNTGSIAIDNFTGNIYIKFTTTNRFVTFWVTSSEDERQLTDELTVIKGGISEQQSTQVYFNKKFKVNTIGFFAKSITVDDRNVYMAVGSPSDGDGKVFVYFRAADTLNWQLQEILLPDPDICIPGQNFGASVAFSGDANYLLIGSPDASYVKTKYKGLYNQETNYSTGDIVQYQSDFWEANVSSLGQTDNILFPSFVNYNQILYDLNLDEEGSEQIPFLLAGNYPFTNTTADHVIIRVSEELYQGIPVDKLVRLKWNTLTNANQTQLNLTNRQPFDGKIAYFDSNNLSQEFNILYKINAILYVDQTTNVPQVGDVVTTTSARANVVYVYTIGGSTTIYIDNVNGEFLPVDTLFINDLDFVGEYTISPAIETNTEDVLGGYLVLETDLYTINDVNSDSGRGLVLVDVALTFNFTGRYYYNILDYNTSIEDSQNTDNSLLRVLSYQGQPGFGGSVEPVISRLYVLRAPKPLTDTVEVGDKVSIYFNNLKKTVSILELDRNVTVIAGEILSQANTSATCIVFENATNSNQVKVQNVFGTFNNIDFLSASQSGNILARPTIAPVIGQIESVEDIGLTYNIVNRTDELFDIWDGYIDYKITNFLDGNPFEPLARYRYAPVLGYIYDYGQGQLVEDITTGARAEVMFYQRSSTNVTIFVKNVQGQFSKGDLFGDNAEIRMLAFPQGPQTDAYGRQNIYTVSRVIGQIQSTSLGYSPANIGKLLVFDSLTNLQVPENDELKDVEYWIYKIDTELLGVPREVEPPSLTNLDWKSVYIIPTEPLGQAGTYAKEGIVTVYRRFGTNLVLVRSFVSSDRSAQHRYGSEVKITYQNGLYRGFVTASESNVFYDGPDSDSQDAYVVTTGIQIYRTWQFVSLTDPDILTDVRIRFLFNGEVLFDLTGIDDIDDRFGTSIRIDGDTTSLERHVQLTGLEFKVEDKEKIYFAGDLKGSFAYTANGNEYYTDNWYTIIEDSYGKIYFLKTGTENNNLYNWEYAKNKNFKGNFLNSVDYQTGDIVYLLTNGLGTLYTAITNISAGEFDIEQWTNTDDLIDYVGYIPNDTTFKVLDDSAQDSSLPNIDNVFEFGLNYAVSADGQVLIASVEYFNEPNVVAVYRLDNGFYAWSQNIISPRTDISFGKSLAINDNGTIIAIGAPEDDTIDINTGIVLIYKQIQGRFESIQTLNSPQREKSELFGSNLKIDNNTLIVSAYNAENYEELIIDKGRTTFDNDLTRFKSFIQEGVDSQGNLYEYTVNDTGNVYIYESINDRYIYADSIGFDTQYSAIYEFGKHIYLKNNHIYVGLPVVKTTADYFGTLLDYRKPKSIWNKLREPKNVVKIDSIKRVLLYNKNRADKALIQYLDYIDPLQGKIAGIAEENLSYKLYYDPAVYTDSVDNSVIKNDLERWADEHVGELWWDLTNAKFYYPSQEDVIYTANNFNKVFLSNTIDIYEWVKSDRIPSEYDAISDTNIGFSQGITGKSKYGNNAYSSVQEFDYVSQSFTTYYYFWVKDTKVIPDVNGRTLTGFDVAKLIADPKNQGYKFVSFFSDNSFALYNLEGLFESTNVSLSIQYNLKDNINTNVHNQYQIITEGLDYSLPNKNIEMKWIDSLVGYDQYGRQVPDPKLGDKEKYGILNTPRQSWFQNRIEALKQYVARVNRVLQNNLIVGNRNLSNLQKQENFPDVALNLYDTTVDTRLELDFLGVAKARQAEISLIIKDGVVTDIVVLDPGRGYLVTPSYTVAGKGSGLVLEFQLNAIGSITAVNIVNGGKNYTDATIVTIRKFSVLVISDETIASKWALYERDSVNKVWNRIRSQAYNVNLYWDYINWYADGYGDFTDIDFIVNYSYQLTEINADIGDIVKISNVGTGGWLLLKKVNNIDNVDYSVNYDTIGRQGGTIQLKSTLYDTVQSSASFDSISFDSIFYDSLPTTETRLIFNAIKDDIFINDLAIEYSNLFFAGLRYVLKEQQYVDWVFKTSFIKAKHNVGELRQDITFNNDNLASYEEYINEVKPFKAKLREYVSSYENLSINQIGVSDFDLQARYDLSLGKIVPVNVRLTDAGVLSSRSLGTTTDKNWLDNLGFEVVNVVIAKPGQGYQSPPVIEFVGGGGFGAVATTTLGANGSVIAVNLISRGSGYTTSPDVRIKGSLGDAGTDAEFSAVLGNSLSRSLLTKIKFDRISKAYSIDVLKEVENFIGSGSKYIFNLKWPINLKLSTIVVTVDNQELLRSEYTFRNVLDRSKSYTRFFGQIELTVPASNQSFIEISYEKDISILNAADRINLAYNPAVGSFGKELAQLMDGIDYGGVELRSFDFGGATGWDTAPWYTGYYDTYDITFDDEEIRTKIQTLTFNYNISVPVGTRIVQDVTNVTAIVFESTGNEVIKVEVPFFQDIINEYELRLDDSTLLTEPANDSSIPLTVETTDLKFSKPLENNLVYNVYINDVRIDDPNYSAGINITNPNATMQSLTGDGVTTTISIANLGVATNLNDKIVFRKTTSDGSFLPTNIQYDSLVLGGALDYTNAKGIAAEEINVDGDSFYTPTNSKGPEEFVPGIILDTLDITVFERPTEGASNITSVNYYANGNQNIYSIGTTPIEESSLFVKVDNKIQTLGTDYIVKDNNIEFLVTPAASSKINLITLGYSGVNILDIDEFIADGKSNKFITNIRYQTEDISAFVTIDGKIVNHILEKSDSSTEQSSNIVIVLPEPPELGKIIKFALFDGPTANYSTVTIDKFTYDGSTISYTLTQTPFNQTPTEWYTIVKVNDDILNAGYNEVFDITSTREYRLKLYQVPLASLNRNQVKVYLNDIELEFLDQWTFSSAEAFDPLLSLDQQSGSTILLSENVGVNGDKLRVFVNGWNDSTLSGGDYRFGYFDQEGIFISTPGELFFDKNYNIGDIITVYQFSNHDSQGLDRISFDVVERTELSPGVLAGSQIYLLDGSTDEINLDTALEINKNYSVFLNNVRIDDPNFGTTNPVRNVNATVQTIAGDLRTTLNIGDLGIQANAGDILKLTEQNALIIPDESTPNWYELRRLRNGFIPLNYPAFDDQYTWVIVNGKILDPSVDYYVTSNKMTVKILNGLQENDTVEVIHFTNKLLKNKFGWRQSKNILNRNEYKVIDGTKNIKLAVDLNWYDKTIILENADSLPSPDTDTKNPGVIYVDKERIEYFIKDGNTLKQLRRGTLGTGVKSKYEAGLEVYDQSADKTIPYKDETISSVFTADGTTAVYELDFVPNSVNDFEVFVAGRRLRKVEIKSYQLNTDLRDKYASSEEKISQDSPEGDITLPAEFNIQNGNQLVLLDIPLENQKVIVIRQLGKIWNESGKTLSESETDIAKFLQFYQVDLPR